jgi:hypothetical protein
MNTERIRFNSGYHDGALYTTLSPRARHLGWAIDWSGNSCGQRGASTRTFTSTSAMSGRYWPRYRRAIAALMRESGSASSGRRYIAALRSRPVPRLAASTLTATLNGWGSLAAGPTRLISGDLPHVGQVRWGRRVRWPVCSITMTTLKGGRR